MENILNRISAPAGRAEICERLCRLPLRGKGRLVRSFPRVPLRCTRGYIPMAPAGQMDIKRECPDTPAVLGLYRASRDLIDGIERLIDERYGQLSAQIYDENLTAEEKRAAAEQVRRACYREAAALQRAREDARQAYRRDRIDQMNQIIWKKTLNPKFQPTITTIPPPAAAKKS